MQIGGVFGHVMLSDTVYLIVIANVSLFALTYVYGGYLSLLKALRFFKANNVVESSVDPKDLTRVTVLVTAYNEEAVIEQRIKNILGQSFSPEKLDVLIASDNSTDSTDAIVSSFKDPRVKLFSSKLGLGEDCYSKPSSETN